MKTIREIADEIGVSKQAVFKKIKREPLSTSLRGLTSTVDGRLTVSVDGEKLIKQAFSQDAPSTNHQPVDGVVDGQVDGPVDGMIAGQLEVKDRQIEQQAQTITRLSDALVAAQQTAAAAQALHAGTLQQQILSGEVVDVQEKKPETEKRRNWFSKLFKSYMAWVCYFI